MLKNCCSNIILFAIVFHVNIFSSAFQKSDAEIDSLVRESDTVILHEKSTLIINDLESAEYEYTTKILIKNKDAENFCRIVLKESEFVKINDIEAVIKDTSGNIIKELDSDDIKEAEASINNFYSGNLYNWFELTFHIYPYVLEYTISKELLSLFFWPDWHPQSSVPTLVSEYVLINEEDIEFSYFPVGEKIDPVISQIDGDEILTWKLTNIPKIKREDYMPPENNMQVGVLFKSKQFILDDYEGSTDTWNKFAIFYKNLTDGRYQLPENAKAEINSLVRGVKDKKEKVEILYSHLQKKNRYVDIEMGITGWQPKKASEVYETRYGDCKDLSTYMVAILEEAGVKSYPALVLTRDDGVVNLDFPSSQFNHCVTMVPIDTDTIWLECTASYNGINDTPFSIEDIHALVITDDGGEMIHTPQKYSYQNLSNTIISGELSNRGNLNFSSRLIFKGNRKNYVKPRFIIKSKKDDIIYLQHILNDNYSNVEIEKYEIDDSKNEFVVEVDGVYNKFVSKRGKRLFINPAIYNRETLDDLPEEKIEEREYPVYYNYPFLDVDSVALTIQDKYELESIPKNKSIEKPFGNFYSRYDYKNNTILYSRRFEILQNKIPVESYENYLEFLNYVIKADKSKIIFKRK